MRLDTDALSRYLAEHAGQRVCIFGLTWVAWTRFAPALEPLGGVVGTDAILFHTGGWKHLAAQAVGRREFRERFHALGVPTVIDFYGMAEQVGSVHFENPRHFLHCPVHADVIVRDPETLEPLPAGEVGLVQVTSVLPTSYPGHSILTEDLGVIRGEDEDGAMLGKCFEILGRVPRAVARGCSDVLTI
jgi:hypothetical protein